ncbi:MAG: cupredoxin domain-containing protein [Dehalococcoidales bacterium]|nr:cupredoxin domain-containing protein [Dehalococcoidales bacterium]
MKKCVLRLINRSLVLVVVMVLVGLGACTSESPTPPATPTITITSPTGNIIPQIGNVTVTVQVSNFNLVEKKGEAKVAGEGHIHYFKDVEAPTAQGQPAVTAAGTYAATAATSYTWPDVTAGTHTFSVELVNNDHTPLSTPVVAKITVTVTSSQPPPSGGQSIAIDLSAQNYAFDKSTITVPAGASVTINFNNKESVSHNFALYTNSSASTNIFRGDIINGPRTIVYKFTAPATPGNYFFRCDVHPTSMTGTFVVTAQ